MERFARLPSQNRALSGLPLLTVIMLVSGCASVVQLPSRWADQPLALDGNLTKWSDSTMFMENDGIRIGVMNDQEYFYLCMISSKPNIGRQLIARGMTVWFDPRGGKEKVLGVRFPLGVRGRGMTGQTFERQDRPEPGERDGKQREAGFEGVRQESLNEFEFLGPAPDDIQRVSRLQGQGLEMHLTSTMERFVYQLRVPLRYSSRHPYALETSVGSALGITLETNPLGPRLGGEGDQRPPGGGTGGMPPGGGRPGAGGRTGQRPGGITPTTGRAGAVSPITFDIRLRVQLAGKTQ